MKKSLLNILYYTTNKKWKNKMESGDTGADMNEKYINYLSGMLERPILDAGCGLGRFHADVRIDFEPKDKRTMKVDLNGKLPFENNRFRGIICHHVLEHLDNPNASMKEFHRILKFGGRLLVAVPHKNNPNYRIASHKHFFTEKSLKEVAKKNNFKIEQLYGFIGTDFFIHPIIQKLIGKIVPNEIICIARKAV